LIISNYPFIQHYMDIKLLNFLQSLQQHK